MKFKKTRFHKVSEPQRALPTCKPSHGVIQACELPAEKNLPVPRLGQVVEHKISENHQLRRELDFERERFRTSCRAKAYLEEEVRATIESLGRTLTNFQRLVEPDDGLARAEEALQEAELDRREESWPRV